MVLAAYHVFGTAPCKLAYICGDEASFVLTDYDELDTTAWMDYDKAKVESVMASLMSVAYGRGLRLMGLKDLPVFGRWPSTSPRPRSQLLPVAKLAASVVAFARCRREAPAKALGKDMVAGKREVRHLSNLPDPRDRRARFRAGPLRGDRRTMGHGTTQGFAPTTTTIARATRSGGRSRATSGGASKTWSRWFKRWGGCYWYATEKARDQAFDDLKRHCRNILKETEHEPLYRKVELSLVLSPVPGCRTARRSRSAKSTSTLARRSRCWTSTASPQATTRR